MTVTDADTPLPIKLLTAGTAACVADFVSFPLDTAKVRLQIQGEGRPVVAVNNGSALLVRTPAQYNGLVGTIITIARQEGPRSLYNGLSAGLQRQMCFASVRLGLYDSVKTLYQEMLDGNRSGSLNVGTRIAAGLTTGALAVLLAQPTDVVKVRFQAQQRALGTDTSPRYKSTIQAYRTIAKQEGARGLWKGTPGVGKSTLCEQLAERTGMEWLEVGQIAKDYECFDEFDEVYQCPVLDEDKLLDELEDKMAEGGKIVDYHGCDFFPERWFDIVFVLRTNNTALYDRLASRGYTGKKLQDNVQCEIFQTILEEAQGAYKSDIVHELPSNTPDEMDDNLDRIATWVEQWKLAHS